MIRAIRADTYDGGRWLRLATVPCPECGPLPFSTLTFGDGEVIVCPTCNGTRTVSPVLPADLTELWVGVERWREHGKSFTSGWNTDPRSHFVDGRMESRLALVYRCSGVTVLPVVDWGSLHYADSRPCIQVWPDGRVLGWEQGKAGATIRLDDPWAAGLVPGDVVLDLGTVEAIDPITEMVCAECNRQGCINPRSYPTDYGTGIEYDADPCPVCSDGEESGSGSVPLVLPSDRVTEIEVP